MMPGFLLLLTGEGKLLYLSDSVSEYLGHSMVSQADKKVILIKSLKAFSSFHLKLFQPISNMYERGSSPTVYSFLNI